MSLAGRIELAVGPSAKDFWPKFRTQIGKTPKIDVGVSADLKRFQAEMAAERRKQQANAINLRVKVDESSIRKAESAIKRIEHTYTRSALSKAIRIQVYVAGAAALPALTQGILSLTAAVTELGRSFLLLPGILSSVGAVVGTFGIGIRGVGDALKAMGEGTQDAARKAREYEKATRGLEKAQRDVVQALKEANREIEDQKDKLSRNQLSVEQARLNVQKANERLMKGGFDSISDYQQAILDQKQAVLDLSDALKESKRDIQDYYDNVTRSATGTDKFKDSVDALHNAFDEYTKKQLEAAGLSENFIDALSRLSPKARESVQEIAKLGGAWKDLKESVQDNLFDGIGKSITELADKQLPVLKKGMGDVAKALNADFKQLFASLGSDKSGNAISQILQRTATALNQAKPGIDAFVNGFLQLSEVGSRFLPRLAAAFNTVMQRFEAFVDRADKDGSLERWIDRGLDTITSLGNSLKSIGSILSSVTEAYSRATGNIGGFATTMEKGLAKLANYLASPSGQKAMIDWIDESREFISSIKDALPGIGKLFHSIGDGARFFAEGVFPIFAKIGTFLNDHAALVKWIISLYFTWKTVTPIIRGVEKIWGRANTAVLQYRENLAKAQAMQQTLLDAQAKRQDAYKLAGDTRVERDKLAEARNRGLQLQKGLTRDLVAIQGELRREQARLADVQDLVAQKSEKVDRAIKNQGLTSPYTKGRITELRKAVNELKVAEDSVQTATQRASQAFQRHQFFAADLETSHKKLKKSSQDLRNAMNDVQRYTHLADEAQQQMARTGTGRLRAAIGNRGSGLIGTLGGLVGIMGGVVSAIGSLALTGTLIFALDKLADAQQKAGDRAAYHRNQVDQLKNSLDENTGAVTAEGTQQALRSAQEFEVTGKGNKGIVTNAVTDAGKLGISPQDFGRGFDPTQIDAINRNLDLANKSTLSAIRAGRDQQWNGIKDWMTQHGVTDEVYAKAINGDPASKKKFEDAVKQAWKENPGSLGGLLPMSAALPGVLPDLGTAAENLLPTTPGVSVGQATNLNLEANRLGGNQNRQIAKPGRLSSQGAGRFPGASDITRNADGSVSFNVPRLTPQQAQSLAEGDPNTPNTSASLNPLNDNGDGTSRYSVTLPQGSPFIGYAQGGSVGARAGSGLMGSYYEPMKKPSFLDWIFGNFARGGPVWGAGTATSDSIPALLSNGEYVINAKSAAAIGHDRLDRINRFAAGGPVPSADPRNFKGPSGEYVEPIKVPSFWDWIFGRFASGGSVGARAGSGVMGSYYEPIKQPSFLDWILGRFAGGGLVGNAAGLGLRKPMGPVEPIAPLDTPDPWTTAGGTKPVYPIMDSATLVKNFPGANNGPKTLQDVAGLRQPPPSTPFFRAESPFLSDLVNYDLGTAVGNQFQRFVGGLGIFPEPGHWSDPMSTRGGNGPNRNLIGGGPRKSVLPWNPKDDAKLPPVQSLPDAPHGGTNSLPGPGPAPRPPVVPAAPPAASIPVGPGVSLGGDGRLYVPDLSGSGALADTVSSAASAAANAPINPSANILNYLVQQAQAHGLRVGAGSANPDTATKYGTGVHSDDGAQHSFNRALDIGSLEEAQQGKLSAFVQEWISDPEKVASTRQLIFRGPDGDYGITNGRVLTGAELQQVYGGDLGAHADHIHLALEGVPLDAFAPGGGGAPIGGGAPTGGDSAGPAGQVPQIPGINTPIQGPFGPVPFDLNSILGNIGQIILQAIGSFFGIDLSGIFGFVNQIAGGFPGQGVNAANPDPNVDPGPDQQVIDQLEEQAKQAEAAGDTAWANELRNVARNYRNRLPQAAPGANVTAGSPPGDIAKFIYNSAISRGYSPAEARAITAYSYGESSFNPTISGGVQRAAGDTGPDSAHEVLGLFQQKEGFAGLTREQRIDPVQNVNAYLDRLAAHRDGGGDIYDQLLATSRGGPMYTGGRKYMAQLESDITQFLGFNEGGYVGPHGGSLHPFDLAQAFIDNYGDPHFRPFLEYNPLANARGGPIRGPGGPTDDKIPALLSNGEYVIRAAAAKRLGMGRLHALNNVDRFSGGGPVEDPNYPGIGGAAGISLADDAMGIGSAAGSGIGGLLTPKAAGIGGVSSGWGRPQGGPNTDPRSTLAPAPTSDEHTNPALSGAIHGAASTIGSLAASAASMGITAAGGGPLGGQAAAAGIQAGAQIAGDVVAGAANVISSFLVGTVTPAQTGQGYGAPLLAQPPQPAVQNYQSIHNGNIVTNNLEEYSRLKDRKDAQKSLPFFNRVDS